MLLSNVILETKRKRPGAGEQGRIRKYAEENLPGSDLFALLILIVA